MCRHAHSLFLQAGATPLSEMTVGLIDPFLALHFGCESSDSNHCTFIGGSATGIVEQTTDRHFNDRHRPVALTVKQRRDPSRNIAAALLR